MCLKWSWSSFGWILDIGSQIVERTIIDSGIELTLLRYGHRAACAEHSRSIEMWSSSGVEMQ